MPILENGEPIGPIENGTTYIVRPFIAPAKISRALPYASRGLIQLFVGPASPWKLAQQGKRTLFPIRLDDAVIVNRQPWAVKLRAQYEIVDFTSWMEDPQAYQQALLRLLNILKLFAQ